MFRNVPRFDWLSRRFGEMRVIFEFVPEIALRTFGAPDCDPVVWLKVLQRFVAVYASGFHDSIA